MNIQTPLVPAHNLFEDHGPRCPTCSGLGRVLYLGNPGSPTKSSSPCACKGTGVDLALLQQQKFDRLEQQVTKLQQEYMRLLTVRDGQPPQVRNSRQFWEELIAWATADGTAVANTTTEAILFPNITVPGNYMQDGRALKLELTGRWSNVVTAVPTLTFAVRWGGVAGTVLCTSGAVVTPAAATTNAIWSMKVTLQTRLNGATGTIFGVLELGMGTGTAPTFGTVANYGCFSFGGSAGVATPAAVTVDLTADTALSVTADWSAANASNTLTGHTYHVESKN